MEREEEIIAPIPVELLKQELTEDKLLRKTNKGNNEIYIVTWHNAPNVLREIGRLREIAFRSDGGCLLMMVVGDLQPRLMAQRIVEMHGAAADHTEGMDDPALHQLP